MNSVVKRIVTVLVSLILLFYVSYQAYAALYNPIRTTRAESGTYEDIIKADGFVLHDEKVITQKPNGVIDYVMQDGESVQKGGVVAVSYKTAQDAADQRKIQQINAQIQQYQQMGNSTEAASIDIDVLNSEIEKSFLSLSDAADSNDARNVETQRSALLTLLDQKQLATGEIKDFDDQVASLQKQSAQLASEAGAKTGTVNAPEAGYFVSETDGFENAYPADKALSITAGDVKKLLSRKPAKVPDAVGKIITGYESYIVCTMDDNDAYNLQVGSKVNLQFLLSSGGDLPVTVAAINKDSSGCSVVLSSEFMSSALAVIRKQQIDIVTGSYTGIKVPDSMIHIVNGVRGVYVRNGNLAQFRKLDEIYSADGYVVSGIDPTQTHNLQLYDEIIINGDDLYDGKIIK